MGVPRAGGIARLGATRSVTLPLTGTRRGCSQARDFTERTLSAWSLDTCREDARTVVNELAANALLHAFTEEEAACLKLTLRPAHLVCAVIDHSDRPPVRLHFTDLLREHGHGLHIVEALSEHWGWTRRFPAGKTVWAMLPIRSRD
ncbi:ATP-binding protein [Streptomyces sp. NPDC005423]|uniref:ATP-binding protein n=1 Tax=Streptomyces sp. NPDC005423 TaxID=3155343 RepID=UPI0033AA8883